MSLPILVMNSAALNAVSMGSNQTSLDIDLSEVKHFSVHEVWTGTPVGNIIIEASNTGSDYVTIDTKAAGGAAGSYMYNSGEVGYKFIRIRYAFTSSTGTLTCTICGKR